jgi:hypothetical protein
MSILFSHKAEDLTYLNMNRLAMLRESHKKMEESIERKFVSKLSARLDPAVLQS